MPRKKEIIYSIEMQEEDTLREYHNPVLNFVSKEKDLETNFLECDVRGLFKSQTALNDLKTVLKNLGKKSINFIDNETFFIDEISISKKPKPSDKYIYRLNDYNENKEVFCGFNEVLDYIRKKIKNKHAVIYYNGVTENVEFSIDLFSNILVRMTGNTHQVSINQINGKGEECNGILITPFKLM